MNSPVELLLPEGLASPSETYEGAFLEGLTPDPELTVWEWADLHRVLPKETSAEYGAWRTDRVPLLREIMGALSPSDECQEVTLAKGTQLGGTEVGNNFIGFVIDSAPGPMMMVLPTSNTGKRSSKTRVDKMINASPRLAEKVAEKRSRDSSNTTTLKEFSGGVLIIAGANSAAELASSPVRYLFLDELDSFPDSLGGEGSPEKLAEKRTDTFVRKKIFKNSSVKGARGRSKIMKNWRRGDQRRAYVPCPHCDHRQVLVWEQMRWETRKARDLRCTECGGLSEILPEPITGAATSPGDDLLPSPALAQPASPPAAAPVIHTCPHCAAEVAESQDTVLERDTGEVLWVHYECIGCNEAIDEHHKPAMFTAAEWVPEQPGAGRPKSYHLSSLYSPLGWYSWLQAVRDFIEAEADPSGEKTRTFYNTVLALEYSDPGQEVEHEGLRTRAEPYRLRTVPMGGLMLTAAVDVQKNRLEVKVKAYGRGEESWLIAYEVIYGDPMQDDVWESLDDFLATSFPHEGGNSMRILATAVDSGFLTQRVYNFCAARGHRLIFPIKGVQQSGKAILGKPSKQDIDWRGQIIKDGIDLWPIGVDSAKSLVLSRLGIERPGPQCMHFPLGLPDSYYKGLTAERKTRKLAKTGYEKWVWEKESGAANEPFDLEVYAYAAAIRAGITRANWDKLEAFFRGTGDLFVAAAKAEAIERKERNTRDPRTGTDVASPDVAPESDPDACDAATDGEADAVNADDTNTPRQVGHLGEEATLDADTRMGGTPGAGHAETPAVRQAAEPPPPGPVAPPAPAAAPRETPKKPAWIQPRRDWFRR